MEQIHAQDWAVMHFGLIFLITFAQIVVVYVLSGSSNPPQGLGLYTVYFMAALLGWIAYTLQQGADIPMGLDVPSVAAILNSYILFMAAGQRAELRRGRIFLGLLCLLACLSVFFLSAVGMFAVQSIAASCFFAATGGLCAWRGWTRSNVGDGITAVGAALMVVGTTFAMAQWLLYGDLPLARTIGFGVHTSAYVLVAIGFLTSVLMEYQQHLSHLATEDPLTRLLNARGLESSLQVTLAQAARQQLPTSAILVDIDGFSEVNDNFGHETGDQIIRQIAQFLQRMSRGSDAVARTGGDEFLLILPNTSISDARVLAERIRAAVAERPLVANQQRIAVTVSMGLAGRSGEVDLDKLSTEANRALQLAKRNGRNQIASVENRPIHLSTTAGRT